MSVFPVASPPPPALINAPSPILTVGSTPSAITFTVNGTSAITPFQHTYSAGTNLTLVMPQSVNITGSTYNFQNWNDGSTGSTKQVVINLNLSLSATYQQPAPTSTATTIVASTGSAFINTYITFTGSVTRTDTNAGLSTVPLNIEQSQTQTSWTTIQSVTTNASGNYSGSGSFPTVGTYFVRGNYA